MHESLDARGGVGPLRLTTRAIYPNLRGRCRMTSDVPITQLRHDELTERALTATTDYERRLVEYEMWRRSTVIAERSMLVMQETGRGGEVAARWSLALVYTALAVAIMIAWTTSTAVQQVGIFALAWLVLLVFLYVRHSMMVGVLRSERMAARDKLIQFDKEHPREAERWAVTGLTEIFGKPTEKRIRRSLRDRLPWSRSDRPGTSAEATHPVPATPPRT